MIMPDFLRYLPEAATSPLAFVAYVVVVAAWTYSFVARNRLQTISRLITDIPEAERAEIIRREYNTTPRSGLSAEQWIRVRKQTLLFLSLLATLVAVVAIAAMAQARSTATTDEFPRFENPIEEGRLDSENRSRLASSEEARSDEAVGMADEPQQPEVSMETTDLGTPTEHQPSAPKLEPPDLKNPLPNVSMEDTQIDTVVNLGNTEADPPAQSNGLKVVQILRDGDAEDQNIQRFEITLANESPATLILKRFRVHWRYRSGGTASMREPTIVRPIAKYLIELPIETANPIGEALVPIHPLIVVPPGSEAEPNLVAIRLNVFYRLVDAKKHPYNGWDILYTVAIEDQSGGETTVFSDKSWRQG